MAGVGENRPRLVLGDTVPGRRSMRVFVVALVAVMVAISFMWRLSRRAVGRAPEAPPIAAADPTAPPTAPPAPTAAEAEAEAAAAPAAAAAQAEADTPEISARQQAEIARVVSAGRPRLAACYQRALVRDASLVHGNLRVHVSVAPSGHVARVNVRGPAAFRVLKPCLSDAVSQWTFPGAAAAYETEFPLALQASQ